MQRSRLECDWERSFLLTHMRNLISGKTGPHTFTRLRTLFRLRLLLLREVSSRRRSPPMKHVCPLPFLRTYRQPGPLVRTSFSCEAQGPDSPITLPHREGLLALGQRSAHIHGCFIPLNDGSLSTTGGTYIHAHRHVLGACRGLRLLSLIVLMGLLEWGTMIRQASEPPR